jgi:hypothetical protein
MVNGKILHKLFLHMYLYLMKKIHESCNRLDTERKKKRKGKAGPPKAFPKYCYGVLGSTKTGL